MRGHLLGISAAALSLVVASCRFPTSRAASCDDDVEACPQSSKSATSVTCDCRCTVGFSEDTGQNFEGHVAMCLPPELNGMIAVNEQQVALRAVEPRVFDQRVFQFCSKDVAGFLRTSIRMPGRMLFACEAPVTCDCTTAGTKVDTELCHSSCDDLECTARNCPTVLLSNARVDLTGCFCSRATSCGSTTPSPGSPAVCRDRTRPLLVNQTPK